MAIGYSIVRVVLVRTFDQPYRKPFKIIYDHLVHVSQNMVVLTSTYTGVPLTFFSVQYYFRVILRTCLTMAFNSKNLTIKGNEWHFGLVGNSRPYSRHL